MIKALNGVARIAQEMANGNLSIKAHERSAQDALMQALNMMIKRMQEVVSNIQSAAKGIATELNRS